MTTNDTTVIAAIDASEANPAALKDAGGMSTDDIAATISKAVEFLAAQAVPMNTKDAFAGEFVEIPATKLIADVGLDDVQMLVALRDNEFGPRGEDFESTDDDDDRYNERFNAAVPVVRNYLLNLTTKWTARDVKLARVY
jgi:hypothetical protein